jgi:hypothetical protein
MATTEHDTIPFSEALQSAAPVIHEIEELDLRSVFPREDRTFTPWLSQPDNLGRLARALGLEIEFDRTEVQAGGSFRADILAKSLSDGSLLVIENQFGRSDHDHFGKAMTYLAAHGAKSVVWLAESFADEHRAALTWLNDNTPEDVGFYGVLPKLMRIAGSPPGLRFDVVIAPNTFVKQKKREERRIDEGIGRIRSSFWTAFNEALATDEALATCQRRYGGGLGFQWLLPSVGPQWQEDEPHVLVFITGSKGRQGIGIGLECRKGAREEAERCLQTAVDELARKGVALGLSPADFSENLSMSAAVTQLLNRAKVASEELCRAFA